MCILVGGKYQNFTHPAVNTRLLEKQFGPIKVHVDNHLITQNKSLKIITEMFLYFQYVCWLLSEVQTLSSGSLP
jgi:hypothetical protein